MTIARSRAIDRVRTTHPRRDGRDSGRDINARAGVSTPDVELSTWTREVVASLREDGLIIGLAYFSGYPQSEIAKRLNRPLGTVKTRVRRATGLLRTRLAADALVALPRPRAR